MAEAVGEVPQIAEPIKPVEAPRKVELLNQEKAGSQFALLFNLKPNDTTPDEQRLNDFKTKIDAGEAPDVSVINNSFEYRRRKYWQEHQGDQTAERQKEHWLGRANKNLAEFNKNSDQAAILRKLDIPLEHGAEEFYSKYLGRRVDIGKFAFDLASKLTPEDILKIQEPVLEITEPGQTTPRKISLLETIGGFYDKDFAETAAIIKTLTEGIYNSRGDFDKFKEAGMDQFKNKLKPEEKTLLDKLHSDSEAWIEIKRKEDETKMQREEERNRRETEDRKEGQDEGAETTDEVSRQEAGNETGPVKSREELSGAIDEFSKREHKNELTRKFIPVLESLKAYDPTKQNNIKPKDFQMVVERLIDVLKNVDDMSERTKADQLRMALNVFDTVYSAQIDHREIGGDLFFTERTSRVLEILEGEGVRESQEKIEETFNDRTMIKVDRAITENPEQMGKLKGINSPAFTYNGELLRPAFVTAWVSKEEFEQAQRDQADEKPQG